MQHIAAYTIRVKIHSNNSTLMQGVSENNVQCFVLSFFIIKMNYGMHCTFSVPLSIALAVWTRCYNLRARRYQFQDLRVIFKNFKWENDSQQSLRIHEAEGRQLPGMNPIFSFKILENYLKLFNDITVSSETYATGSDC